MQTASWNVRNAQQQLARQQAGNGRPLPIGQIEVTPGLTWVEAPPEVPPARAYQLTPLDAFTFDHLKTEEQCTLLQSALDKAREWKAAYRLQPGLSFVLAGPVGAGKTTIAENLIQPFLRLVGPQMEEGDVRHIAQLRLIYDQMQDRQSRERLDAEIADFEAYFQPREVSSGLLLEATSLMWLMADQGPLGVSLDRYQVIIVDDAGCEDFSTATYTPDPEAVKPVRHNRYGRFFDHCYRTRKHLLITSNTPLLRESVINPDFIDIFGKRAFDRLYQMAKGFMVDLSGLPSYRQYVVQGV